MIYKKTMIGGFVKEAMIINSNDVLQRNIITNRCYYRTIADIMRGFEQKGYSNAADETANAVVAYHNQVHKKFRKHTNRDYAEAFEKIDNAIKSMANKVFYIYDKQSYDFAYQSFQNFDYINAIIGRQRMKKNNF